jgi:hypothetical protein
MATATKPFRVRYAPPGMTWAEAKAVGAPRASEVWMTRYRVYGHPSRESGEPTNYEEAKRFVRERQSATDNGMAPTRRPDRVAD